MYATSFTRRFGVDLPLVQAGMGIEAGAALAAAVSNAGALGTEYAGAPAQKAAIVRSDGSDTLQDRIFDAACGLEWPKGVVGRALRSRFSAQWEGRHAELRAKVATYPLFGFVRELDADAETEINWAGESAGLVRRIAPAAEIVGGLAREAEAQLRSLAARLAGG